MRTRSQVVVLCLNICNAKQILHLVYSIFTESRILVISESRPHMHGLFTKKYETYTYYSSSNLYNLGYFTTTFHRYSQIFFLYCNVRRKIAPKFEWNLHDLFLDCSQEIRDPSSNSYGDSEFYVVVWRWWSIAFKCGLLEGPIITTIAMTVITFSIYADKIQWPHALGLKKALN